MADEPDIRTLLVEIRVEQRRNTERLDGLHESLRNLQRGLYGGNGDVGVIGKQAVQETRLSEVEKDVEEMRGDRRKIVTGVVLAFVGAGFAWIRLLLPRGGP